MFQKEQCSCKGRCDTRRCSCQRNNRRCRRSTCGCDGSQCQNLGDLDTEDEDGGASAGDDEDSAAEDSSGSSRPTGMQMQCEEATYDPKVHNAMWHNDNPFVLRVYSNRLKNCRGCESTFAKGPRPKFVISHKEQRIFWSGHGQRTMSQKACYHCSASCISARHPYFKPQEVTAEPSVARKLTAEDDQLLKRHGINLSFLRP